MLCILILIKQYSRWKTTLLIRAYLSKVNIRKPNISNNLVSVGVEILLHIFIYRHAIVSLNVFTFDYWTPVTAIRKSCGY